MSPKAPRRSPTSRSGPAAAAAAGAASVGMAGGGYSDTDIGKVISAAYFNAFVDLVHYMQSQQPGRTGGRGAPRPRSAPPGRCRCTLSPSGAAPVAYSLAAGAVVYPTGQRNGIWMEVDDENGNRGWLPSTQTTSRQ